MGLNDLFKNAEGIRARIDALSEEAQNKANLVSAECNDNVDVDADVCNLTDSSNANEILEFIMLFLCKRLKSIPNAYKGGFVLSRVLLNVARLTHDIDFSISDEKQYEDVKAVLAELGDTLVKVGLFASYVIKPTIEEHMSGGIDFIKADGSKEYGIDVGLHDISYGTCKWNYHGFTVDRFMFERMLADKLSVIFSPKRFRRAKDLYDFYIIITNFDIDLIKLREALTHRELDYNKSPMRDDVIPQYEHAYNRLQIFDINGVDLSAVKPEFDVCLSHLSLFMRYLDYDKWDHVNKRGEYITQ